jgi:hypothetical protein
VEYFCKYLSICYLGSANPSHGDKNSGKDGFRGRLQLISIFVRPLH